MNETPKLEWALGIVGLVLILGSIGFMIFQVVSGDQAHPDLRVEMALIENQGDVHLVVLRVVNRGDASARNVRVTGRLRTASRVETREVTLDYVPAGSSRRAGLCFRNDPRNHRFELRAEGYQEP